jgi:hypothetical protein
MLTSTFKPRPARAALAIDNQALLQGEHQALALAPATTRSLSQASQNLLLAQPALFGSDGRGVPQRVVGGAVSDLGLDAVQPASLGGGDPMVTVGQEQSLLGAEGNYRGQVAWQLGVVAHPAGSR